MKLNILLVLAIFFSSPSYATVSKDEAIRLNVYMAVALANYYCEKGNWPRDLKKLKKIRNEK